MAPSNSHGAGLFLDENVLRGYVIIEYTGGRITMATSEERDAIVQQPGKTNNYMLRLRETDRVIDPSEGNSARYCSHNCKPNAEFYTVKRDCHTMIVVFVRALVNIPEGAEITVNHDC